MGGVPDTCYHDRVGALDECFKESSAEAWENILNFELKIKNGVRILTSVCTGDEIGCRRHFLDFSRKRR